MENKIYIYGLSSNDGVIRYVGQSYRPFIRKNDHICEAKRGVVTHKNNWIRKVLNNNESIEVHILDECNSENWVDKERYWISKLPNLTNTSDGGEGSSGKRFETTLDELKKWLINIPEINSEEKWREWVKIGELPKWFPKRPDYVYKNDGWVSWNEFLGNKVNYLNYNELKEFVTQNNIKSMDSYIKNRLENMPYNPAYYYKNDGWVSWYEFLDKEKPILKKINKIKLLSYSEAKIIIKQFNFTTKVEYTNWYLKNKNLGLPRNPILYYNKDWVSYEDFFGNALPKTIKYNGRKKSTQFLTYDETKNWVNNNFDISSETIWRTLTNKLPYNIPKRPDYVYKNNGWVSWSKFLKNN